MHTRLSVLTETLQRWTVRCCGLVPQEAIEPQAGVGQRRGLPGGAWWELGLPTATCKSGPRDEYPPHWLDLTTSLFSASPCLLLAEPTEQP